MRHVLAAALLALVFAHPAAAQFHELIPQGAYSADTMFGPFEARGSKGYIVADVDSFTGTDWRFCVFVPNITDPGVDGPRVVECNTSGTDTGNDLVFDIGRTNTASSAIVGAHNILGSLPSVYYFQIDINGGTWTGEAMIVYVAGDDGS